jgi:alkylation response protein AidB-like acyl-CoA dehydrogenase
VNFDLGPDELALRDGIRELCAKRFPIESIRKGFDRDGWRALGDAGVFSLRLTEQDGGVGLGMTEAVIVFEELGRALVCGPLVATHLAAGFVEGAASGERVVTIADGPFVEFAAESDAAIVLDESVRVIEDEIDGEDVEPLDPLTPVRSLAATPSGRVVGADAERLRLEGACLSAALSSGIASRTVDVAVGYARQRVQFDRPIGSFQAVKHLCADMLVRAEVARAAVDAAGTLFDQDDRQALRAVATAKLLASEAAIANAKACVQVHGGMGFTWEVDVHLYLKRAAVLATHFGGVDAQSETVAALL